MWVRTQTADGLVDVSHFELRPASVQETEGETHIYGSGVYLGTFSTKEKAINELQRIETTIFADKDRILVHRIRGKQ